MVTRSVNFKRLISEADMLSVECEQVQILTEVDKETKTRTTYKYEKRKGKKSEDRTKRLWHSRKRQ
jgi:hypothetical protein